MERVASQRSVAFSQFSAAPSELSSFGRELPQEIATVKVEIPRGLRGGGSLRVTGQVKASKRATRTYNVTIEPNAREMKTKDAMRIAAKPFSDSDYDFQQSLQNDPELEGILEERALFRNERVKHFQVGSHFPALVSPRLVPSWRLSAAGRQSLEDCGASGGKTPRSGRDVSEALTKPTASKVSKQQAKRSESPNPPWRASGMAGAEATICDRGPALFDGTYDSPQTLQREEYNQAKDRWVGEKTILPTKASPREEKESDEYIAAMRERGHEFLDGLNKRYEVKRSKFRKEKDERGPWSNFEMSIVKKKARIKQQQMKEAQEKKSKPVEVKPVENPMAGLQGLGGLGFGGKK